jgi:excisionase family DNA binding protein
MGKAAKGYYTTGEVARLCMLSVNKVNRLIDGGALPAYRVPRSRRRRVLPGPLRAFMAANGLPTDALDAGAGEARGDA